MIQLSSDITRALTDEAADWRLLEVLGWLFTRGRQIEDIVELIQGIGEQLVASGAPVWRVRMAAATLHPQIAALGVTWKRGTTAGGARIAHGFENTSDYQGSPVAYVFETGQPYRRRLEQLDTATEHEILQEIARMGGTDYLALPMNINAGERASALTIASDRPCGFSDRDIAQLSALFAFVTPVLEVLTTRSLAQNLLDTYVGPRTGSKVLRGSIKRGDAEIIEAALWFSDLRDFTALTETLPLDKLLGTLNAYFEFVAAAVTTRGGEILRFIGDAMLIVFPADREGGISAASENAVDAAIDAFASLAPLNHRRHRQGEPIISFGVGLHVGEVVYGNVGAPDRLDFTVMGPAVNRTARLESLTKTVGVPMLLSKDLARIVSRETRTLGRFPMKGIADPQEVFAIVDVP